MARRSFSVALAGAVLLAACGATPASDETPTTTTTVGSTTSTATPTTTTSTTRPLEAPAGVILITAVGFAQPGDDGTLVICPAPSDDCAPPTYGS